jgi:hypothetical protein
VTVANAGAIITLDIDYAGNADGSFDSYIRLLDSNGDQVAFDDDSSTTEGASGSASGLDSYLSTSLATAGTYFIVVVAYSSSNPPAVITAGGTYELQVSIAGELTETGGNDTLDGGAGDDLLIGGIGDDTLTGGADTDTASYAGAGSAVTVDLAVSIAQNTGGAGTDSLSGIEYLIGSTFGDTLFGDSGTNELVGGTGADNLYGRSGSDSLYVGR